MDTKLDARSQGLGPSQSQSQMQAQFPASFPDTFKHFFEIMNEEEEQIELFANLLENKVIPRDIHPMNNQRQRCGGSSRSHSRNNSPRGGQSHSHSHSQSQHPSAQHSPAQHSPAQHSSAQHSPATHSQHSQRQQHIQAHRNQQHEQYLGASRGRSGSTADMSRALDMARAEDDNEDDDESVTDYRVRHGISYRSGRGRRYSTGTAIIHRPALISTDSSGSSTASMIQFDMGTMPVARTAVRLPGRTDYSRRSLPSDGQYVRPDIDKNDHTMISRQQYMQQDIDLDAYHQQQQQQKQQQQRHLQQMRQGPDGEDSSRDSGPGPSSFFINRMLADGARERQQQLQQRHSVILERAFDFGKHRW
ncbi:GH17908 [Drosophila grimshawi]|uniref:GH17908 n=1 Tax=Drosophila grimshawi TaxID=7222 RepID=B4JX93_DROGR|nr:GH17908 [Drosophila grimshawi]